MKQLIALLFAFFMSILLYAQADCNVGTSVAELNINNARATLPMGYLWTRNQDAGYFFPNNNSIQSDIATLYSGGLWFGGVDPAGNLYVSASTYGWASGESSYWPGVINWTTGTTDATTCTNWDFHFQVFDTEIANFLQDWADGTLNNPIPVALLGWPATGNPHFYNQHGFELPENQDLAPFVDMDNDGRYDPEKGDYPNIRGASQAIWWVINTIGNTPSEVNADPPTLEIQLMAYAYATSTTSVNNTTFYEVKYFNRAPEMLDSMFVSLWVDADLGCHEDDYIGCIPEENTAFVYNQDATDGNEDCLCEIETLGSFCENIPIMGIKILEGPLSERILNSDGSLSPPAFGSPPGDTLVEIGMSSFIHTYNDPLVSFFPYLYPPVNALEYYNYMNGRYRDNSPILHDSVPTHFIYPGNPSNLNEWSMCSEGAAPYFRNIIMNMGPLRLPSGATRKFAFCVTGVENVPHPCPDIDILSDALDEVTDFWHNQQITATTKPTSSTGVVHLFPNPVTMEALVSLENHDAQIIIFQLYNASGHLVKEQSNINASAFTLSRSQLPAGVYFYKITTQEGQPYSGKVVFR